jgi:hypothetical protein
MKIKSFRALAAIRAILSRRTMKLLICILCSVFCLPLGAPEVSAAGDTNAYGNTVTYTPTSLRVDGRTVKFYNYDQSGDSTPVTVSGNYNLNSFGVASHVYKGGSHRVGERFRGYIRGSSDDYIVEYQFGETLFSAKSNVSNIGRMAAEGQIGIAMPLEFQWHAYDKWSIKEEYTTTNLFSSGTFGSLEHSASGKDSSTGRI